MSRIDIGFPSGKKRNRQPYEVGFRCDDETIRQLQIVKVYLEDLGSPAENTSEVCREAIKFASIWCRQTQSANIEREEKKADMRMKQLADPDAWIIGSGGRE